MLAIMNKTLPNLEMTKKKLCGYFMGAVACG